MLIKFRKRKAIKFLLLLPILGFVYFAFFSSNNSTNEAIKLSEFNVNNEQFNEEFANYKTIKSNGELGKAFLIDEKKLNIEEKKEFDEGWNLNSFNRYASDRIPLNRSLPDVRLPGYLIKFEIIIDELIECFFFF